MSRADVEDELEFLKSRGSVVPMELQKGLQQLEPVRWTQFLDLIVL